jgi:lipopolysaccharide/colanic/teichoic acid biosynthesis glycosyltransferase
VFGETFDVYKFRSMVPEGESVEPVDDNVNDRITRVGRILRQTHLDEIPQLWSILVGDMSVVGPRAVWTEEESLLEAEEQSWRKRWFVKPGLTGLAQVNDAKSTDPQQKLRYDLRYVRQQSFWYDLKLVARQIWKVLADVVDTIRR